MTDSAPDTAPIITVIPGAGASLDAATKTLVLTPEALAAGGELTLAVSVGGVAGTSWRVQVAEVASDPALDLAVAGSLDEVSFLGSAKPSWSLVDGAARLIPATTARAHGVWEKGGADGLYRCLFRIAGGLAAANDRRFTFGARVRLEGADWSGIRVEPFETSAGKRYLHIREYTGVSGVTTSLATTAIAWDYDVWQWLEVHVAGTAVKGRLYVEGAAAPDWQVSATSHQVEPGGFGPGAFPSGGVSPTIDIRRLEFVPGA